MLSITSRANLADTVARPRPISMATSMASRTSSKDAPALAACSMCHCMQDSQSFATETPTAISSFCLFGNAPSAVGCLFHRQKTRVDFGFERDQSGMRRLASYGNLFEFLHCVHRHQMQRIG